MLRFILCDDNPEHCRTLEFHIRQALCKLSRPYEIALVTTHADEVLCYAQEHPEQNVYMLDLMLEQKMDGLALCQEIHRNSPGSYILYVSAFPEHALNCCRSHSFDFILKPYSERRLYRAIEDLVRVIEARKPSVPLEIAVGSIVRVVDQRDILYFSTDREYITAHFKDDRITWRESMVNLLARVNADLFLRIHKSYAVNRLALEHIDSSRHFILLRNGENLPISRRFLSRLRNDYRNANNQDQRINL